MAGKKVVPFAQEARDVVVVPCSGRDQEIRKSQAETLERHEATFVRSIYKRGEVV